MSSRLTFEKFKAYCRDNNISDTERNVAYSIYEEQLQRLIAERISAQNSPSEEEIATMQETLLAEGSMLAHVTIARGMIDSEMQSKLAPIIRKEKRTSFWIAVSASVLANFFYSILIIILFVVAREEITSLFTPLIQENVHELNQTEGARAGNEKVRQNEDIVDIWIQVLNDRNSSMHDKATDALREIGTPEALKALEEYEKRK